MINAIQLIILICYLNISLYLPSIVNMVRPRIDLYSRQSSAPHSRQLLECIKNN